MSEFMFCKKNDQQDFVELAEGIRMKTLVHGERSLTAKFELRKGSILPLHKHYHEQTGYLLSGKLVFILGDERRIMEPGDSWLIQGGVEHGAEVLEESVAIEVFSPLREEYLPQNLHKKD